MSTTQTPRRTRPTRVLATIAVLATIGGGLWLTQAMRPSTTSEQTFTLDPGSAVLAVDVDRGEVRLTPSTSDRLEVRRTMRQAGRAPVVDERADAQGATLNSRCPALSGPGCSTSYQIAVPAGYVIDVAAGTGRVEVHGLTVDKLQVETSSGATQLDDVKGSAEIDTSSGSITGTRLGLTDVVTRVASGQTSLDFTLPPNQVTATTGSGAVTIKLPAVGGPYRVAAHSNSGDEDVQVPTNPTSSRHINVTSSSGDVRVLPQ